MWNRLLPRKHPNPSHAKTQPALVKLALTLAGLVTMTACTEAIGPDERTGGKLEAFTGEHMRVVWLQDAGDGTDVFATGAQLRLMGFDSRANQSRPLVEGIGHFHKPMITPDGNAVVYSHIDENRAYIVDWETGDRQMLAEGMVMAVWRDPADQREWVYLGRQRNDERGFSFHRIVRIALDDRTVEETIWSGDPVQLDNFQLSADGRRASGLFPWPESGVANLPEQRWQRVGRGCWTAMAPDQSYVMWTFDGSHRNLLMANTRTDERWNVNISAGPVGGHAVYHPRWSNHPDLFALSGPYLIRAGGNNIRGGGPDVEIHLGRFSPDRRSVTDWFQLTDDDYLNVFPDVWIANQYPLVEELAGAEEALTAEDAEATDAARFFFWQHRDADNVGITAQGTAYRGEAVPVGKARFGRNLDMDVRWGYFASRKAAAELAARATGNAFALTLSAWLTPAADADGNGTVFAFADEEDTALLSVTIVDGQYTLILAPEPNTIELGSTVSHDAPYQLTLTLDGERVRLYHNDELRAEVETAHALYHLSQSATFYMGGAPAAERDWSGFIEHVELMARALDPVNIALGAARLQETAAARPAPAITTIRARVTHASQIPAPADIAPYTRGLLQNEYEVLDVLAGPVIESTILINHWVVLDEQNVNAEARREGEEYTIRIEPVSDRPELEGERVSTDVDDLLLPDYLDLDL